MHKEGHSSFPETKIACIRYVYSPIGYVLLLHI